MKTIFTLILIIIFALNSYSQKATSENKDNGTATSVTITDPQSFKITKVYPNPVKDIVNVELQSEVTGMIVVKLYNILGNEVKTWNPIFLSQVDQKLKIDLSFINTGIYILKISNSSQTCTQVLKKN